MLLQVGSSARVPPNTHAPRGCAPSSFQATMNNLFCLHHHYIAAITISIATATTTIFAITILLSQSSLWLPPPSFHHYYRHQCHHSPIYIVIVATIATISSSLKQRVHSLVFTTLSLQYQFSKYNIYIYYHIKK